VCPFGSTVTGDMYFVLHIKKRCEYTTLFYIRQLCVPFMLKLNMENNIQFGTSFSPEYSEYIGGKSPLELLKVIYEELGIKDIRFGIRWNMVEKEKKISLDYYSKYLDYLLKNDCKVCLNIGPIKVFRWPEQHIPSYIQDVDSKELTSKSDLAKYSYDYLFDLLKLLDREYGSRLNGVTFQLENEPFFKFGHIPMVMSNEYILELTKIFHNVRPNSKLMFNSAGRKNLKQIVSLFYSLRSNLGIEGKSLILGFNYYYKVPGMLPLPRKTDPIKYGNPLNMSIKRLHRERKRFGFGLEISEAQFEPWGIVKSPGNSVEDFEYLLKNCNTFFPKDYPYKLVRLWGSEELAIKILNKNTSEVHDKLIQSIQVIA